MPRKPRERGNEAARSPDPTETEQDLRATADSIRADVGRLAALEDEKIDLSPEDPRVDRISDEAVTLADRIARETRVERQLGKELG
jgi:hypothetical protein